MNREQRAAAYNAKFTCDPKRRWPPLSRFNGWVTGAWLIGACYKNPHSSLYGSYPRSYLERVHAMFPDAERILHAFSGGLSLGAAHQAALDPRVDLPPEVQAPAEIELVDLHGPEQGRHPTWQGDLFDFCELPDRQGKFDLVLADPPYSAADAEKYDTPMVNRGKVLRALRKVTRAGGNLVWLDQVWPMHRKVDWQCWAHVALVRSTNHRVRLVSAFEAR